MMLPRQRCVHQPGPNGRIHQSRMGPSVPEWRNTRRHLLRKVSLPNWMDVSRFCQPTEFRGVSQLCRRKYGSCFKSSKPDEPLTEGKKATFQLTPIA